MLTDMRVMMIARCRFPFLLSAFLSFNHNVLRPVDPSKINFLKNICMRSGYIPVTPTLKWLSRLNLRRAHGFEFHVAMHYQKEFSHACILVVIFAFKYNGTGSIIKLCYYGQKGASGAK